MNAPPSDWKYGGYKTMVKEPGPTNLSPHAYAEQGGEICPVCRVGEDYLTVEVINQNAGIIDQNVTCEMCKSTWVDEYHLVGYHDLTFGERFADESERYAAIKKGLDRDCRPGDHDEPGEVGC